MLVTGASVSIRLLLTFVRKLNICVYFTFLFQGFLGSHVVVAFLDAGYAVRGTVRDLGSPKVAHLNTMVARGRLLTLVQADLLDDESLLSATQGCRIVVHVASPLLANVSTKEADAKLYAPAKQGTINVLSACLKNGVDRVVLTSSLAASIVGNDDKVTFDEPEKVWANVEAPSCDPYSRSKYLAEKAAWKFYENARKSGKKTFEMTSLLPSTLVGPLLAPNVCVSADTVAAFVNGKMGMLPDIYAYLVDVRDAARAHVTAAESDEARGERFILHGGALHMREGFAHALRQEFEPLGFQVVNRSMPYWLLWTLSWFNSQADSARKKWGVKMHISNKKSIDVLGATYQKTIDKSVVDMLHSMVELSYPGIPKQAVA